MEWKIITGGGILQDVVCMATGSSAIENLLRPGGNPIGVPGAHATIRVIAGATLDDADNLFNQLSQDGTVVIGSPYPGTHVQLPDGGTVGLRNVMSKSPITIATIDVNVAGVGITKIKFDPWNVRSVGSNRRSVLMQNHEIDGASLFNSEQLAIHIVDSLVDQGLIDKDSSQAAVVVVKWELDAQHGLGRVTLSRQQVFDGNRS